MWAFGMLSSMPKVSSTHSCQSLLNLSTIFFYKLQRVLLNASTRPLAGALYIDEL